MAHITSTQIAVCYLSLMMQHTVISWRLLVVKVTMFMLQVYLGLYTAETYPKMARKLSIWPFPRAHHHALTRLPIKGATLLLADQRFCPLLPDQHRLKPRAGLRAVAGGQHESCSAACR